MRIATKRSIKTRGNDQIRQRVWEEEVQLGALGAIGGEGGVREGGRRGGRGVHTFGYIGSAAPRPARRYGH